MPQGPEAFAVTWEPERAEDLAGKEGFKRSGHTDSSHSELGQGERIALTFIMKNIFSLCQGTRLGKRARQQINGKSIRNLRELIEYAN